MRSSVILAVIAALAGSASSSVWAKDLKITIPRRSHLTPVQRLNRDGVAEVRRHHYEKAEGLFYKAYLYDPADPFTLNNLGYVAELQGQLERAQKFYAMASKQSDDALIARSSEAALEGKPMTDALGTLKDVQMRINRMNFDAMNLLSQQRGFEADALLKKALALDPQNSFTLNNLGVASEATGDYESALRYYNAAAGLHSSQPVIVTEKASWRGKPVSKMAAQNAKHLKAKMATLDTAEARAAMYNLRGVAAMNQNDWQTARQDFLQAYSIDPNSAFSLNNAGYVAEKYGDLETARFFYNRAQKADDANARIGLATREWADGKQLDYVATDSDQNVEGKINEARVERQREKIPIELKHRDGTPVARPKTPPAQQQQPPSSPDGQAPDTQAPTTSSPPQPPQ